MSPKIRLMILAGTALTTGVVSAQSLDQTREWAETQYYQVRLAEQQAALIAPNPFWQEFLTHEAKPFLPHALDLPCSSINEALCALAVMDLPLAATQQKLTVEGEQLVLASETAAVVYLESIEPSPETQSSESILVGQDLYLARPGTDEVNNRPWGEQTLLSNVPYRTNVVVTNPTAGLQRV
ncbi:MAG: hypothetical protein KC561_04655, partial [Myxococcales bacterium]|nr:hypothetical protein [Myxococcales bacterium]